MAASSVLTNDVPCFLIAAGVPAKVIKRNRFLKKKWLTIESWSDKDEESLLTREEYLKHSD